tara:strand:+ start:122 stop:1096 length:975 start_codon:yes stop_codon:yes gene_type:complete
MKKGYTKLLEIISNGNVYSGQDLAASLNVSRTAVWKSIKHLETLGLEIRAIRGKGYQLRKKFEFLSKEEISRMMTLQSKKSCKDIGVVFKTNSTNLYLLNQLDSEAIHGSVVFAEYQSEGRGRRNKRWISPIGSGICFSVGWRFEVMPISLGLLSLYMGIAVARSLNSLKIKEVGLKWPNDIITTGHKIGGILLDIRGESTGPLDVIVGVGINYELPKYRLISVDQPIIDVCSVSKKSFSRNMIAASLLSNVLEILHDLQTGANLNLLNEWRQFDYYIGKEATLILPNEKITGILKGVDEQGSLLMLVDGKLLSYRSGEVSLRI